jgi:hypothetical protein
MFCAPGHGAILLVDARPTTNPDALGRVRCLFARTCCGDGTGNGNLFLWLTYAQGPAASEVHDMGKGLWKTLSAASQALAN